MQIRRNPDGGRQAVTLLATAFVLLLGAVTTAFALVAIAESAGWREWAVWGGTFAGLALLLWSFTWKSESGRGRFWLALFRGRSQPDPAALYRPRRKRSAPGEPVGTNQPPTVESVRQAAADSVQWVPHGAPPDRPRPKPKKHQRVAP